MPKTEPSRNGVVLLWLAGLACVALVIVAVRAMTRERVGVRVGPATFQTLSSTVSTNGKVEPVGEFQAHAPSPGVVQKIYVEVGDRVVPGTRLVDMDSADARKAVAGAQASLASAESSASDLGQGGSTEERGRFSNDIASARAEQRQAQDNLAIEQALLAKGSASAGEVAAARQRLDTANLTLGTATGRTRGRYSSDEMAAARARVADAKAGVAAAQNSLSTVSIRSPIAGTVYSVPVSQYDFVPAGDDLLDVADLNRIQVLAYFDEPDIGKLARGQAVRIVWDAKPGLSWHGHIERAPTTVITYGTRSVGECLVTVDDAKGDLLPNTNVTITVTESQRFNVLSIPREALHTDGPSFYVFRIVASKLVRTPVQVGVVNLTSAEIRGGLSGKDLVVLGPATSGTELTNGLEVKPIE